MKGESVAGGGSIWKLLCHYYTEDGRARLWFQNVMGQWATTLPLLTEYTFTQGLFYGIYKSDRALEMKLTLFREIVETMMQAQA